MDGLSAVFDLPLDSIRALSESRKQALMRLLRHLASTEHSEMLSQVTALDAKSADEHLQGLLDLSSRLTA